MAGPRLIQRRAPLTGCATTSTAAQPSERARDERRREQAQPRVLPARREDHPRDAEHRVGPLPLEVRHRVRAADDGRRRGRAVDHHDSERRQRKRDQRQDVPLRLSPHFLGEIRHQPPEILAALLEIRVLVVARARRREEDDVAGLRLRRGELDRAGDASPRDVRTAGGVERRRELVRRLADEVDRLDVRRKLARERREVLSFGASAEDEPQRRVVGRDTATRARVFVAMESLTQRTPLRSRTSSSRCGTPGNVRSASAIASSSIPAARAAAMAAAAFSRLCRPVSAAPPAADRRRRTRCLRARARAARPCAVPVRRCAASRRGSARTCRAGRGGPARGSAARRPRTRARARPRAGTTRARTRSRRPPARRPRERRADVPRHGDRPTCRAEDRAEQLRRRRLAVRARDADERTRREQAPAELDLGPHGDAALARRDDERTLSGDAGRLHEQVDAVAAAPRSSSLVAVDADDLVAARFERRGGRYARAREAVHERRVKRGS